jgi:hypothetical protein
LDIDFKNVVSTETVYGDAAKRKEAKKKVKKLLRERFVKIRNSFIYVFVDIYKAKTSGSSPSSDSKFCCPSK